MFLGLFHLMTRLIGFLTAAWKNKSENENKQMLRFFKAEMLRLRINDSRLQTRLTLLTESYCSSFILQCTASSSNGIVRRLIIRKSVNGFKSVNKYVKIMKIICVFNTTKKKT